MAEQDNGYKLLFSHAEMVADLLRGFVHEKWVGDLDFDSLEKVDAGFVSDKLQARHSDVVWRLRLRGRWLYVYILIEFQSSVDPFMALRMLVYVGLLGQSLQRQGVLSPSGKLPPIFPIVLYNGTTPWHAPVQVSELFEEIPGGLSAYLPRMVYRPFDLGSGAEEDLAGENLVAALARLEQSPGQEEAAAVTDSLLTWLSGPERAALRHSFTVFLRAVLLPRKLPGLKLPEFLDLKEVRSMLAQRNVDWTQRWRQEGFQEGVEQGREQGLEQSLVTTKASLKAFLESRFGALPVVALERLESIDSLDELIALTLRAPTVSSLAALDLA